MHLSDIKTFVSTMAVITTVFQFLSGVLVCKQYVANKTTGEASPLPFTCGIISTTLWLLYGLNKHDNKIVLVNTVGLALMMLYTVVFYMYTFKKSTLQRQLMVVTCLILFTVGYVNFEEDHDLLLGRLGMVACVLTLVTVAAPLTKLFYVIKVKSTECLPFHMILMSFFVSTLWLLYGLIEEDPFLTSPNFIGAALALCQLALFAIYPGVPNNTGIGKTLLA